MSIRDAVISAFRCVNSVFSILIIPRLLFSLVSHNRSLSVLPALIDDVCDAVNFYGSGKNSDTGGSGSGSGSGSVGAESGVGAKMVIGASKTGKAPASRPL